MDKIKSFFQNPQLALGVCSITAATTLFYLSAIRVKEESQNKKSANLKEINKIDPTEKVSLCQRFGEEEAL